MDGPVVLGERCQARVVRIAAHYDHRLRRTVSRSAELRHSQIAVGGQPPIESHLVLACTLPKLGGTEIEEVGGYRLFGFVCLVAEKDNQPGMSLVHLGVEISRDRPWLFDWVRGRRRALHRMNVLPWSTTHTRALGPSLWDH